MRYIPCEGEVTMDWDPYAQEIYDEWILVTLCERHFEERAMDV
jgi:hypothetical protein